MPNEETLPWGDPTFGHTSKYSGYSSNRTRTVLSICEEYGAEVNRASCPNPYTKIPYKYGTGKMFDIANKLKEIPQFIENTNAGYSFNQHAVFLWCNLQL